MDDMLFKKVLAFKNSNDDLVMTVTIGRKLLDTTIKEDEKKFDDIVNIDLQALRVITLKFLKEYKNLLKGGKNEEK